MAQNKTDIVHLTDGLSLQDLISDQGTTFEINFNDYIEEEEEAAAAFDPNDVLEHVNTDCLGLEDEDVYLDGEPFELLAKKMLNILENGKVKKRILTDGNGPALADKSYVTVHYNAYLEYNDEPFDSTYLRNKMFSFILNDGQALPALDIAVQSMKIGEKSQFLVHHDLAYGVLGCLPRVPPAATILYEIEVKNCVDAAATTFPTLNQEQQKDFKEIYKYAHALCGKGNDFYTKKLYKKATKEYNTAVAKLEDCVLKDYDDQLKQQELLLRLRTNLVIAYTKVGEPRRACINCNKIFNMCKQTSLNVPVKVYFNHGRSLMMLSDYEWAERQFYQAKRLEPQNAHIAQELIKLDKKRKESRERDRAIAKAMFQNTDSTQPANQVTTEFKDSIMLFCKELIDDAESTQYALPDKMNDQELRFAEEEAKKRGLEFKKFIKNNEEKYFIIKVASENN